MVGDRAGVGAAAEQQACSYLQRCGLELLERNYRVRGGEIDIVARDGATLVFVEVRCRASLSHGGAAASVDGRKRQRLLLAARHYLLRFGAGELRCRFDVMAFEGGSLRWIRDAFGDSC